MVSDFRATCITVDEPIIRRKPRRTAASYVGDRFERLLIVELVKQGRMSKVLCRCDCGQEKVIQLGNIVSGMTRSCGCLSRELQRDHRPPTRLCFDDRPHAAHGWRRSGDRFLCGGVVA